MSEKPAAEQSAWEQIAPVMFDERRWAAAGSEVDQALALLELDPPARVLDLACGPGRHLLELARRGFHATGVDATAGLLETPRRMAEDEGLGVELVHADMREFVRARSFDAALSMATSFGYFPDPGDDRLVLANVLASLRAGGALLMELQGKEVVARSPRRREWLEEAGTVLLTEQLIRDDWTWVDNRLIFLAGERRQEFTLSHRLYSAAELRALLVDVGFGSVAVFGDLSGSPYGEAATALVVVARA